MKKMNKLSYFLSFFVVFLIWSRIAISRKQRQRPWVSNFKPNTSRTYSPKIAICMFYTPDIKVYAKKAEHINRFYAQLHNYEFIVINERLSNRDPRWDKVLAVERCLEMQSAGQPAFDYVFWIDSDAYFNNLHIRLEQFVNNEINFAFCDDPGTTGANTGAFFTKNDEWSRDFLKFWWTCGTNSKFQNDPYHEQDVLDVIFKNDLYGLAKKMVIYPAITFNSDHTKKKWYNKNWDSTFIVHLMGSNATKRTLHLMKVLERQNK